MWLLGSYVGVCTQMLNGETRNTFSVLPARLIFVVVGKIANSHSFVPPHYGAMANSAFARDRKLVQQHAQTSLATLKLSSQGIDGTIGWEV